MVNVGPQLPESPKTGMPCECGLLIVHRKVLTDDTVVRTSDDIGDLVDARAVSAQGQQHTPSWVQRDHRACYVYAHGLQRYSSHVFYMLPCPSWRFAHTISGNGASYLNPSELSHRKQTVELLSASLGGHHLPKPCNSSERLLQISLLLASADEIPDEINADNSIASTSSYECTSGEARRWPPSSLVIVAGWR